VGKTRRYQDPNRGYCRIDQAQAVDDMEMVAEETSLASLMADGLTGPVLVADVLPPDAPNPNPLAAALQRVVPAATAEASAQPAAVAEQSPAADSAKAAAQPQEASPPHEPRDEQPEPKKAGSLTRLLNWLRSPD